MRWIVVALVTLTLLSGCAGALDQEPTPTVTPVDVPTVAPDSAQYPAGLDEHGLASMSALADEHREALVGIPYRWEARECRKYVRNGTVVGEDCGVDRITFLDDTAYRWNHTAGPGSENTPQVQPGASRDSYANGTVVYRRFEAADRVWYERDEGTGKRETFSLTAKHLVQQYFAVNRSTVERVERNDRTVFRVVGTDHRVPGYSRAQDYRVVAIVDPSGLVREFEASYSRAYGNLTVRTTVRSEYRDVGDATLEPPWWIDAARENVSTDG